MTATDRPAKKPRKERKENADKRRKQLLEAALASIEHNGLAKTTLATVANEAGLSQGVAVFYYKSKNGLLTAALEHLYQHYEDHWQAALAGAAPDPKSRLLALVEADFAEEVCNRAILSVWFSFWGEQNFTPQYASLTQHFDNNRVEAIERICQEFFPENGDLKARELSEWIDTLTDGYWQRMYLFPESCSRQTAIDGTRAFLSRMLPDHF
ncbi:TetR family transcriptional regulator C-terminal domain-containing protein [uncultured Shimia sp.]|uniref:TetR family transcriptional regulator C-terminal domain-containing protein n=1 Tax=uncultured Shimia sp. TaxID=573152 RepID=UPI0026306160|nr:TetR family transcriptional regulator C-terminal domain-containing protein [uncultured Shimia sp.]